jgi:hypothetical protein
MRGAPGGAELILQRLVLPLLASALRTPSCCPSTHRALVSGKNVEHSVDQVGRYRHRFPLSTPLSAPFTPPCPPSSSALARFSFTSRVPLELSRYASGRRTLDMLEYFSRSRHHWRSSPRTSLDFVYALHVLLATSCAL